MKKRSFSINLRITSVAVLFSLVFSITAIVFAYYNFRQSARQNLLQTIEFKLNLVSELIGQDFLELDMIRSESENNDTVAGYLSNTGASSSEASHAYESLSAIVQAHPSYRYLLRIIMVSEDGKRILQTGSGTSSGIPVRDTTIRRINEMKISDVRNQWQGISLDPFSSVDPAVILVSNGDVFLSRNLQRSVVGTSYLMVSLNIIQDSLRNYTLSDGSSLHLRINGSIFSLDTPDIKEEKIRLLGQTDDSVMNSRTVISECADMTGTKSLAVECPIGTTNLSLIQIVPLSTFSVFQDRQMSQQIAAVILCSMLMGVLLLFVLRQIISKPLSVLKQRLAVISQGDFTKDPSVEWNDEIGEIGKGINNLAENVQYLMDRRVSDEKARQELEYEVLLSQVNPHFLYNTLNSIKWMASIQQAPGIVEMTSSLARLLKTVSKGQHGLITMEQELALLNDYFTIQKYRYGGSIVMNTELNEECACALIPRFTLQPLLENSIFHGIEPKGGVGTVSLNVQREGNLLCITLTDDGVGIPEERIPELLSENTDRPSGLFRGIGISTVNTRIRREFGDGYGLTIESKPGLFTTISMHIPYITASEQEEDK